MRVSRYVADLVSGIGMACVSGGEVHQGDLEVSDDEYNKTTMARLLKNSVLRESGCREWIGATVWNGYGRIAFKGANRRAHRVSWVVSRGDIPAGLYVLHSCDNPKCIRVEHLFLGTAKDNAVDKSKKGRCPKTRENKLSKEDVQRILESPLTVTALAHKYKVRSSHISMIRIRKGRGAGVRT
jgi:hypothetical protein